MRNLRRDISVDNVNLERDLFKNVLCAKVFMRKSAQFSRATADELPGPQGAGVMIEAAIALPILFALLFGGFAIIQMTLNVALIERNLELAARAAALETNATDGNTAAHRVVDKLRPLGLSTSLVNVYSVTVANSPITHGVRVDAQFVSICSTCEMLGLFSGMSSKTYSAVVAPSGW